MTEQLSNLKLSAYLFRGFLAQRVEAIRAQAVAETPLHREVLLKIADELAHTADAPLGTLREG